jgi:acetylornithine deacetylase/succinyl-diaminopimelate desuccinylase-like protein
MSLSVDRREFLTTTLAGAAGLALVDPVTIAQDSARRAERDAVVAHIAPRHAATVKMLQDWIALPSIAAEDLNYPQGADYMARLARDAGFDRVDVIQTSGKPGVFATLDAGADSSLGIYFMYDVKQFDATEWSSPPLEGRLVERPGVGTVIVGRGATNTKGPQIALLSALHAFKAAGRKPPVNIVLVCEG